MLFLLHRMLLFYFIFCLLKQNKKYIKAFLKGWIQLINAKAFWLLNFCKYTSFGELN
jgi:hypothetical protein